MPIKPYNPPLLITILFLTCQTSCKKLVQPDPPTGFITTQQVFATPEEAAAAAAGMYYNMINPAQIYSSGAITVYTGMSADELYSITQGDRQLAQFQNNDLKANNGDLSNNLWATAFSTIYTANSILANLATAPLSDSLKNELTGEAEFVRAFCDFYLVNLFGDIPLVNSINWQKTNYLSRTPAAQVYQAIILDLQDAQKRLPPDFSVGHGQRIIPNKWAATALLARAYLYTGDWTNAAAAASLVIANQGIYSLASDLNTVFLANSQEAIWQLQQSSNLGPAFNATNEGFLLIPYPLNTDYSPFAVLTPQLLSAFEPGDQRRIQWIDSTLYGGSEYSFPYKYKVGPGQIAVNGVCTEYYMVLRLAEQYLIRAEARARLGETAMALTDLNTIRERAGLRDTSTTSSNLALTLIAHENQIEFFAEWGHRWLDLKRTNTADSVLSPLKPLFSPNALLYPIPATDLKADPNLTQNKGY